MKIHNGCTTLPLLWAGVLLFLTAANSAAQPSVLFGPSSVEFVTGKAGTPPTAQSLFLSSDGGAFPYEAKAGYWSVAADWMSVTPSSGTTPATLTISADTTRLGPGVYFGYVELRSAAQKPSVLPVTLRIGEGHPELSRDRKEAINARLRAEPNALKFRISASSTEPLIHAFAIGSTSGPLNFTASSDSGSWLAVGPHIGGTEASNTVSVAVNPANLPAGTHTGIITVAAPGAGPLTIPVTVDLVEASATGISADKSSISLQGSSSGPAQTTTINLTSSVGAEAYAAVARAGESACNVFGGNCWLTVAPTGGTTPASLTVRADPSALPSAGTYMGSIDLRGGLNGEEIVIPVTFVSTAGGGSGGNPVTATPSSLTFTQAQGGTPPTSKTVQLSSTTAASFTAASNAAWLTVTPTSGSTPATLTLTASAGSLTAGTYQGTVNVTAGSSITPISVTLTVTASTSTITHTPSSVSFSYTAGGTTPSTQTVQLASTTPASFTAASSASWLTVTPTSGNTPSTLTLGVNPAGLNAGTYQGNVTITSGGTTSMVPVTLTISANAGSVITATPSSVSFTQVLGGSAPATQTVQLTSPNATTFTAASTASWLAVTPTSGATPATLTLTVNAAGLTPGTYQGSITVTAGSATTTVAATLTVTSSTSNAVAATPNSLSFSQTLGSTVPAAQSVQLSSTTPVSFTAVPTASWLKVSPTSGTTPAAVNISVNAAGLIAGTYQGAITITAGATTASIPVTFTVMSGSTASAITATPASLSFLQNVNGTAPNAQTVQLTSSTATNFTATSGASWLSVTPISGTTPATLTISANGFGLPAGTYQGSVTVATDAATTSIPVTLTLSSGISASITATPPAIAFSQVVGQNAFSLQNVQLTAASSTGFSATSDQPWLMVSPATGNTPATLIVSASPGMAAGTYQGTITITGGPTLVTIPVVLTVSVASNAITVSPATITFSQVSGGAAPVAQTLQLSSPSPTNFTASGTTPWLVITPSSGTTPASLSLTVNPAGLTAGSYQDTITINGGATPVTVPVAFTITADSFTASPASLSFTQSPGGTAPNPQTVQLASSVPRNFTVVSSVPWLGVSPVLGTTPATLTVSENGAGLAVGAYQGTITVNGAGAPLVIPVSLTVAVASGAVFSPAALAFSSSAGGQAPPPQTVAVTSAGSPFSFTATATAGVSGTWLTVTPASGTTPATLTVAANPSGLAAGRYSGIVTVTPTDTSIPAQTLPVTLTVGGTNSPAFVRSILNAASLLPGPVAPGEIITITGTGLGPTTGAGPALLASGAIDTQVAGTRVLFDGIAAPLLFVRADQINAIVPYNVYGRIGTNIVLEVAGVTSDPIGFHVENTAPAVFTIDGSGRGQAAVVNQDGTVNSPTFAAARGSVISIFGTGEGQTMPAGQDGRIVTVDVRMPLSSASAKIGGVSVPIRYVGSAPGQVSGLFQMNVFLPPDIATGPQLPLELTMGSFTTQFGLTIAVK